MCASPGFARTPSAVAGTAGNSTRPPSTGRVGNSPTATSAGPTGLPPERGIGTGTFEPTAASAAGDTGTVSPPGPPRFTPVTRTAVVRPRVTPSGKTPVTTGTGPTCIRYSDSFPPR